MCVYSEEAENIRDAKRGERLVVRKFPHAIGFSPVNEPGVAACVLPGAQIAFEKNITTGQKPTIFDWILALGRPSLQPVECDFAVAKLIVLGAGDGLELPDGSKFNLSQLTLGQRLKVVQQPARQFSRSSAASPPPLPAFLAGQSAYEVLVARSV